MIGSGLTKYRDVGLLILRVGIGAAFIGHGLPKLMGGPEMWHGLGQTMGNLGIHFAPTFWGLMAALAESVGGLLLILGLFFRPVCLFLAIDMIVALTMHLHSPPPLGSYGPGWSHPMELAILFVSLLLIGPGKYSVDRE